MTSPLLGQTVKLEPTLQQEQWMNALRDDALVGNCGPAFHQLQNSGSRQILELHLTSSDWQQRLLAAVLLAQDEVPVEHLDLVCRILIWHLEDNEIRGDALVSEHALIVLGDAALPWLDAALWHRNDQLGMRAQSVVSCIKQSNRRKGFLARSEAALLEWTPSLRCLGEQEPKLGLSAAVPTEEEQWTRWILDLQDDSRKGNAVKVFNSIRLMVSAQDASTEFLWSGLESKDYQQRVLIASLLMRIEVEPRSALFRVAMECLGQDSFGSPRTLNVANANLAQQFFMRHPEQSPRYLLPALESVMMTPRLRAAAILAQMRYSETHRYVPFLVERLQDNRFPEDAVLAGKSLAILGPGALPWLKEKPVDAQQALYFEVIRKAIALRETNPYARLPFSKSGMYRLER